MSKRKTRSTFVLRVFFFIISLALLGTFSYFYSRPTASTTGRVLTVSTNGSVTSADCTLSLPCRTIQQAVDSAVAGDTIEVLPGTYKAFKILSKSDLTIRAKETGVTVIADLSIFGGAIVLRINESTRITIEGLTVSNAIANSSMSGRGAFITLSDAITLRNNTFQNNQDTGVTTGHSHNTLIQGNTFFNSSSHGLYISNSSDNITIQKNKFYNIGGSALQVNAAANGLSGEDGISRNVLIEQNTIFNAGQGMNLLGVQDSTVRNNLLWGNNGTGIVLARDDDTCTRAPQGPKNISVLHNTVIMATGARYPLQVKESLGAIQLRNNIFSTTDTNRGFLDISNKPPTCPKITSSDLANINSDYNIFTGPTARIALNDWQTFKTFPEWQALGKDTHSRTLGDTSSLFVGGVTYRLASTSPARNTGTITTVLNDIDDDSRPSGNAPDIGSDEFLEPDLTPLSVVKVTDRSVIRHGKTALVTLTFENPNSVSVPRITITDTIPSDFSYVPNSASSNGSAQSNTVTWSLGSIAPQEQKSLTYLIMKN